MNKLFYILGFPVDPSVDEIFTTIGQDSQLKLWNLPEEFDVDLSEHIH
jgi:hypothetical protein